MKRTQSSPVSRPRADFLKSIPRSSQAIAIIGVFSLFASMGLISMLMSPVHQTIESTLVTVAIYGGFAVGYAALWIARKFWLIPVWAILQAGTVTLAANIFQAGIIEGRKDLEQQLVALGGCAIVAIVVAYIAFINFIRREGSRYFRIQTEIELAREIHRSLVPTFERKLAGYEIFGASVPSGEVGGDLVDIAESSNEWIVYITDISGHGVASGVLMAMLKTSIRGGLGANSSLGALLEGVHRTLYPLKMPNMFATAAVLQLRPGSKTVTYSLAGHPALMRYCSQKRTIVEYASQNLPLGILPEQQFATDRLECDPGDVLLLLTDGFSEVFDVNAAELGMEPIKNAFLKAADRPLSEIFERLRNVSLSFGKQDDDQTILLVRCT
ncbi:MAG TPA: PP2C family protein-serine/threonine phosphatase [Candidatus Sulfotelmatobacter sp.]|nr:PP2C family protein-serine/threonine phosphatase [Candidatus Sulfotelmatobacter sp.]